MMNDEWCNNNIVRLVSAEFHSVRSLVTVKSRLL